MACMRACVHWLLESASSVVQVVTCDRNRNPSVGTFEPPAASPWCACCCGLGQLACNTCGSIPMALQPGTEQLQGRREPPPDLPRPGAFVIHDFRSPELRKRVAARPASQPVRLVQWNIERGYKLAEVIKELQELDADVLALQEVCFNGACAVHHVAARTPGTHVCPCTLHCKCSTDRHTLRALSMGGHGCGHCQGLGAAGAPIANLSSTEASVHSLFIVQHAVAICLLLAVRVSV
jgi:hypothetical protein